MGSPANAPSAKADGDLALVQRAQAGETPAFDELFARYRRRVYAQAYRQVGCHADAQEITQDTFLSVHRGLGGFRAESTFATWLYRIASNLGHNRNNYWFRRRRRRGLAIPLDAPLGEDGNSTLADSIPSSDQNPAELALTGELAEIIRQSVQLLANSHQQILMLRNLQNRSYLEIAGLLGISIGTVKSRLGRAREHLRALMEDQVVGTTAKSRATIG